MEDDSESLVSNADSAFSAASWSLYRGNNGKKAIYTIELQDKFIQDLSKLSLAEKIAQWDVSMPVTPPATSQ